MMLDQHQPLLLYGAAAAVRLLLSTAFPSLPTLLAGRVEVSTPVSSFKRRMDPNDVHVFFVIAANTRCSARRPLSIYPQCVSVRRWCLPSSAPPTTAILAPPEPLVSPFHDESSLHIGGPAERLRASSDCGERPGFGHASVQVFEERLEMEQLGRCCRV
jgi:hypothetical protein